MSDTLAFIGDVHGFPKALDAALQDALMRGVPRAVLLGDYIDKGPDSLKVVETLMSWNNPRLRLHAIRGNHEALLEETLASGDLRRLLKSGGAPTIRSFVGGTVGADVFGALTSAGLELHFEFLSQLPDQYIHQDVVATHESLNDSDRYRVSAHRYVGRLPLIGAHEAQIDTGCGNGGLLTVLFWPSMSFVQFTEDGEIVGTHS